MLERPPAGHQLLRNVSPSYVCCLLIALAADARLSIHYEGMEMRKLAFRYVEDWVPALGSIIESVRKLFENLAVPSELDCLLNVKAIGMSIR